jgi:hypothetical protein
MQKSVSTGLEEHVVGSLELLGVFVGKEPFWVPETPGMPPRGTGARVMVELPLPPSSGLLPVWVSVIVLDQTLVIVELARKVLLLVMLLCLNVHTLVLGTTVA